MVSFTSIYPINYPNVLGGGFKSFLFSPLPGEMIQFDQHIFQMGWFNHQPDKLSIWVWNVWFPTPMTFNPSARTPQSFPLQVPVTEPSVTLVARGIRVTWVAVWWVIDLVLISPIGSMGMAFLPTLIIIDTINIRQMYR